MRIHYLQHVPFEDLANIAVWAEKKGYAISGTMLFKNEPLPNMDEFDWLIIMGGPMGVYDEDKYPWLKREKIFIEQAIKADNKVLGICLGAQLIAEVLGAKIYKNKYKEIGWFKLKLRPDASNTKVFGKFPKEFIAFHWHGDTFDIPQGAVWTVQSDACLHQAFVYNEQVVGLQFHLESSKMKLLKANIFKLLKRCLNKRII